MRSEERFKKEYRLLALAVVFFAAGAIFFWYDASMHPSSAPAASQSAEGGNGVVVQPGATREGGGTALDPDFAKYPAPSQFRTFTYGAAGINGSSTFSVSATCNAAYLTVLVFSSAIDYRADINAAVYNHAFACSSSRTFTAEIATSDIATAPFGTYYVIIADQGTSGTWYNPR